jgi:cysteine synthase A
VAESVLDLVGNTPLVRLNRVVPPDSATVYAKIESQNPGGSVKDRIALAMIEAAEASGELRPGATIIEPTSGNTGIGLAIIAAAKGYRLVLTMPDDMSLERRKLLTRLRAELMLTPREEGMTGAVEAAHQLMAEHADWFMPQQFENTANPEAHRRTTAQEILTALGAEIHAFVAGVGTGGTITGVGQVLKAECPGIQVVAVEPARSPVLSGGTFQPHAIQGIGANFIPPILDRSIIDEILMVEDKEAEQMSLQLAQQEGLLVGISSGANVVAAGRIARRLRPGHTVVTILPDTGERYLSLDF